MKKIHEIEIGPSSFMVYEYIVNQGWATYARCPEFAVVVRKHPYKYMDDEYAFTEDEIIVLKLLGLEISNQSF